MTESNRTSNQQDTPPQYPELCWLIEHKPGVVNLYFTGDHYQNAWTDDPNKALRFPSRHVAVIARNVYWQMQHYGMNHGFNMPNGGDPDPVRICEHLWMQGEQPVETSAVLVCPDCGADRKIEGCRKFDRMMCKYGGTADPVLSGR